MHFSWIATVLAAAVAAQIDLPPTVNTRCALAINSAVAPLATACGVPTAFNSAADALKLLPSFLPSICSAACAAALTTAYASAGGSCATQVVDGNYTLYDMSGFIKVFHAAACVPSKTAATFCLLDQATTLAPLVSAGANSSTAASLLMNKPFICSTCAAAQISAVNGTGGSAAAGTVVSNLVMPIAQAISASCVGYVAPVIAAPASTGPSIASSSLSRGLSSPTGVLAAVVAIVARIWLI